MSRKCSSHLFSCKEQQATFKPTKVRKALFLTHRRRSPELELAAGAMGYGRTISRVSLSLIFHLFPVLFSGSLHRSRSQMREIHSFPPTSQFFKAKVEGGGNQSALLHWQAGGTGNSLIGRPVAG